MMYLQDFVKEIDVESTVKYLREVMRIEDDSTYEEQVDLYTYFVNKLSSLTIIPHDDCIILGFYIRDSLNEELFNYDNREEIYVSGYYIDDIKVNEVEIKRISEYDKCNLTLDMYDSIFNSDFIDDMPVNIALDFIAWEDVLGWCVDENNINKCGKEAFGANVLNELSFNGITEEAHQERLDSLKERLDDFKEIMKLPEEEREKHFHSIDEVFDDLGITDDRTEEEKERDNNQVKLDAIYNCISKCQVFRDYLEG